VKKLLFCFLVLSGCAHTRIESWEDGKMVVCQPSKRANLEDLMDKAKDNGCRDPKPVSGKSSTEVISTVSGKSQGNGGGDLSSSSGFGPWKTKQNVQMNGSEDIQFEKHGKKKEFCVQFECKQ